MTRFRYHDILLKLVVEWLRQSRFPAKMMLVYARALLDIEKISYSYVVVLFLESKAL